MLWRSSPQQGETIGFSNVDLYEAHWEALCGHWSQSYPGENEPHPARVSLEAKGTWQAPSSRCFRGLLTSGPLDTLSPSAGGVHERSPRFLSVVGPTYVGPGGKLALGAPEEWVSGECIWERAAWLCQFSEGRGGQQIDPAPDREAGTSPGKGA